MYVRKAWKSDVPHVVWPLQLRAAVRQTKHLSLTLLGLPARSSAPRTCPGTRRVPKGYALTLLATLLAAACAGDDPGEPTGDEQGAGAADDLPLGDVSAADMKADGAWGYALQCKTAPVPYPVLVDPRITISIDGQSLHLTDPATGFDKVFPVGVGQIDVKTTDPEYRESLSYYPLIATGKSDFTITPASTNPCKTWWTDPATGEKLPVFAGLPFMAWYGGYAIHGPIDNFRAINGGTLRRGYVSHGCIRMEAADVLEVYGRIKGLARVPVHVQREPERSAVGTKVDVPSKWIGAECSQDSECGYTGGFCAFNGYSQRGFCSARCTRYCADRAGYPATFCVADAAAPGQGMCVAKVQSENFECRPYDHFVARSNQGRFGQPTVKANVCLPGSPGWVGDHCLADADCKNGTTCEGGSSDAPGICTMRCDRYCADQPGWADTFCANVPSLGGGNCLRQCTPASNAAECPSDTACGPAPRNNQPSVVKNVCLP